MPGHYVVESPPTSGSLTVSPWKKQGGVPLLGTELRLGLKGLWQLRRCGGGKSKSLAYRSNRNSWIRAGAALGWFDSKKMGRCSQEVTPGKHFPRKRSLSTGQWGRRWLCIVITPESCLLWLMRSEAQCLCSSSHGQF